MQRWPDDLSDATAWPLIHLGQVGDGHKQGVLAKALGIEGPSLVRLLDRLCALELVVRVPHGEDRRANTICLTEKGRAHLARIEEAFSEVRQRMLQGVPGKERRVLMKVLDTMGTNAGLTVSLYGQRGGDHP